MYSDDFVAPCPERCSLVRPRWESASSLVCPDFKLHGNPACENPIVRTKAAANKLKKELFTCLSHNAGVDQVSNIISEAWRTACMEDNCPADAEALRPATLTPSSLSVTDPETGEASGLSRGSQSSVPSLTVTPSPVDRELASESVRVERLGADVQCQVGDSVLRPAISEPVMMRWETLPSGVKVLVPQEGVSTPISCPGEYEPRDCYAASFQDLPFVITDDEEGGEEEEEKGKVRECEQEEVEDKGGVEEKDEEVVDVQSDWEDSLAPAEDAASRRGEGSGPEVPSPAAARPEVPANDPEILKAASILRSLALKEPQRYETWLQEMGQNVAPLLCGCPSEHSGRMKYLTLHQAMRKIRSRTFAGKVNSLNEDFHIGTFETRFVGSRHGTVTKIDLKSYVETSDTSSVRMIMTGDLVSMLTCWRMTPGADGRSIKLTTPVLRWKRDRLHPIPNPHTFTISSEYIGVFQH